MKSIAARFSSRETILPGRVFRSVARLLLICFFVAFLVTGAWGAIPASERTTLLNLYTFTNGDSWTNNTNWNGDVGTECSWWGVTCDYDSNHVVQIQLGQNNLIGTLPDLSGLTNLDTFFVDNNQLTGSIPSLSGLTNLKAFGVDSNLLTSSIPSLSGLTNLQYFYVDNNQLTGSIPSLSGLTNLQYFYVNYNQLTGSIPSLSGLTNLQYFRVGGNQLTGPIPSLSGLTNLQAFRVGGNQLTGPIPSLSGLTNLQYFFADNNQLTGSIPSLSGLTNLQYFYVYNNQLTGSIPSLSGLTNLQAFRVGGNQLTGPIPSLSGLTNLQAFEVAGNLLTGDVPAVPSPDSLVSGGSYLCPNYLNPTIDPAWDAATGSTPWYQNCTAAPAPYSVYYSDNGSTGGSVPVDSSTYFPAQMVTVLGNTGALYETGNSFAGWNTAANGSGTPYVGGDTFAMGGANVALYAQWTTASGSPVRIAETLVGYPDIRSAYEAALNGQTIEAQDGLGSSQNPLLFDNPNDYNPFSVKLIGGFNSSSPHFTTDTGATLVIGGIEISRGSIEIGNIIIQ